MWNWQHYLIPLPQDNNEPTNAGGKYSENDRYKMYDECFIIYLAYYLNEKLTMWQQRCTCYEFW